MNKIAVIGGRDSVLGFRALGLETCIAENGEPAKAAIHRLEEEQELEAGTIPEQMP